MASVFSSVFWLVLAAAWPLSSSLQGRLDLLKFCLEAVAILVGRAAHPQKLSALAVVGDRGPDADMLGVEGNHQPEGHQHDANPDPELPGMVRNLEARELRPGCALDGKLIRRILSLGAVHLRIEYPELLGLALGIGQAKLDRRILRIVGFLVDLVVLNVVVRNPAQNAEALSVGQRRLAIQRNLDHRRFSAVGWRCREGECLGRAGLPHARLINANSLVHKRIVDHDRLGGDFLAVFDQRQLGPPFFRTAVGVGLLSGAVAADQEWKRLLSSRRRGCRAA